MAVGHAVQKFVRSFDVDRLAKWDAMHPGNAVRTLFARWAMPGIGSTFDAPLRLGVRDRYVNFYIAGQSVARLRWESGGPKVSVHRAYVEGRARGSGDRAGTLLGKNYEQYDADALASARVTKLIGGWITTARTYATAEKRFVDRLIEANPGVIDLEMGLPAGSLAKGGKAAPRMDLVVAQRAPEGPVSIAFWEAKCSINGELRSKAEYAECPNGDYKAGPKVIHQLRKYARWMCVDDRFREVQRAYRDTAVILLGFHRIWKSSHRPACVSIWERLAASDTAAVILPPGVVIGNYCPPGHTRSDPAEARSFERSKETFRPEHHEKLVRQAITVHEIAGKHHDHALPLLPAGRVSV